MPTDDRPPAPPRRNLVGLGRAALAAEMADVRRRTVPGAPAVALDLSSRRHRFRGDDFVVEEYSVSGLRRITSCAGRSSRERSPRVDGTRKWLLRFPDGQEVETVHIPEEDRGTLVRLLAGRLHAHLLVLPYRHPAPGAQSGRGGDRRRRSWSRAMRSANGRRRRTDRQLTNIVLMGMGEPLYNYDNVAAALKIVMDPEGLSISRRKITLSTAGVVPMIAPLRRRARRQPRGFAACGTRRHPRPSGAAQPQIPDCRAARRLPDLSGLEQRAADHLRIRHAEGRQRQPGRGARAGAAVGAAFPPRSI